MTDPAADRTVPATTQHPGMTQIARDGRCFQVQAIGADADALLDLHARCVALGAPLPDYGRRWPVHEETK